MGKHETPENQESTAQRNDRINRIRSAATEKTKVEKPIAGSDLPARGEGIDDSKR